MDISSLTAQIAAVAPIDGVAVGVIADKKTWRVDFRPEATDEQRRAASDVLVAFDPKDRRTVLKSVVLSRLTDQQLDAALQAMNNRQKERWRSPDTPSVFVDDPEVVGLVMFIGADPAVVLA